MILKHCSVVVKQGQVGHGVDVKIVGGACVVVVMDHGGNQRGKYFEIGDPILTKNSICQTVKPLIEDDGTKLNEEDYK
jgi:hypothetical protein